MNGGLSVISDLSKTDVYALSRWVNENSDKERIPLNSIDKPPSAELKPNQIDPFDQLDLILEEIREVCESEDQHHKAKK